MSQKLQTSKASGIHKELSRLAGTWQGTAKTWFDPARLEDESPISGTIRPVLDGNFVLHEYKSSFKGQPLEGIALIGYHLDLQQYQIAWVDSFHNGSALMFSQSKRGGDTLDVLGSYAYITPEVEQHWGWRTQIESVADNEIVITAYNISPEGEETKATETVYKRVH